MFRSFGPMEIALVLLIVLIVFGVGKLPQVGGALGKGLHEFRKATRGESADEKNGERKGNCENESKVG